ncbi:MAG: sigma-70 family RNA polymerase sigma factor [Verrucomicrobiales bacterium]|nr:sigma-70 family RNA polymerase sigma factor [Verrucomicrobiales bacterium]
MAFFEATVWSTILKAQGSEDTEREAALERLLKRYRGPILLHIQTVQRCAPEQAEDLTQEFFLQGLRLEFLKDVSPDKGRFRTFIKRCVGNFLRDRHVRESALKRGGGQVPLSLDQTDEDGRRMLDPAAPEDRLEMALDRAWALSVLEHATEGLREEYREKGQEELFSAMEGQLGGVAGQPSAAEVGKRLGMKEGAVHTAMHRMRARLGERIREEVRQTVRSEDDWREELKYLVELLGRG